MQPYNFLILDEPTNHLDIVSCQAIETAMNSYKGTFVVVSHDRHFLDAVCDGIYHMTEGRLDYYTGNYSMFREQLGRERNLVGLRERKRLAGLKPTRFKVVSGFTEWATKKKYKIGDVVHINDVNEHLFQRELENGSLKPVRK